MTHLTATTNLGPGAAWLPTVCLPFQCAEGSHYFITSRFTSHEASTVTVTVPGPHELEHAGPRAFGRIVVSKEEAPILSVNPV